MSRVGEQRMFPDPTLQCKMLVAFDVRHQRRGTFWPFACPVSHETGN